jgi:guanylate kinase
MPNDQGKGRLIILSGPSGVGKGTICQKLLSQNDHLDLSISATTRPQGPNEVDGKDYHFCTPEEFKKIIDQDGFLEWAEVHGKLYGTPKKKVQEILDSGKDCILEIDVQGGQQVLQRMPEQCITIFVAPPSEEELWRRIKNRDRDKPEAIAERMKTAQWEMTQEDKYQYTVINDDLPEVVEKIIEILDEKRGHTSAKSEEEFK